ncbi:MAG: hypothetical protein H6828_07755 [Planctomycetes bacterium]|nr:hypothetical protein [Planctomycetota bacterium]
MSAPLPRVLVRSLALLALVLVAPAPARAQAPQHAPLGTAAHREEVQSSRFCAECHPVLYEEHRQNTHGLAFHDEEARLATRGFRREDCIRCHTPRPVFETGIGMTPMQRWTNLDEGNTCMSCHGRARATTTAPRRRRAHRGVGASAPRTAPPVTASPHA